VKEGKTKRVINRHDLVVVPNLSGASKDVMQTWLADEGAMYASDRLVIDTADKRNALEEYVYETRSKLEMAWTEFVIDSERVTFMKSLNEMEDWLYGEEGESATKSLFVEKLESLTNIGHPIALRAHQFEERPLAEKEFRNYVSSVLVEIGMDDPKYAHIEKTEMEKVKDECTKKLGNRHYYLL
jgi:heat shock protein 4